MKKFTILFMGLIALVPRLAISQVNSYVFTTSVGTYTSITGTSPVLTGNGIDPVEDEGFTSNIPLGFSFNYLGINYTTVSASTNGFAAFGNITITGYSNNISSGIIDRPVLAPFWEDNALTTVSDIQYATTGSMGSRIFTLQWSNVFVDFGATAASLSFQLRLYETTNKIEFIYQQLPSSMEDFSGGASIGITDARAGSFLSLNNSSTSPAISSSVATNNILSRPVTGQIYSFTPPACMGPYDLQVTNITINSVMFSWAATGSTSFEFALSTTPAAPSSGTLISSTSVPVVGLEDATQYYLHVRSNCGGTFSGWSTIAFTTACIAANIPYTMPLSNVMAPALPPCSSVKDENLDGHTWRTYSSGGPGWTGQVIAYVYNSNEITTADDWLFTAGLNLTAGTYYRLRFKYNNDSSFIYPEKLKVAFGDAATANAMTNTLADYLNVSSLTPKIAIIDFTPSSSGVYYIGFQAHSDANEDVLILDDISVDLRPSCDVPSAIAFDVASTGTSAGFSWTAPGYGPPTGYEYAVTNTIQPPASGTLTSLLTVTIGSLSPNTQYYFHIHTSCGGSYSEWVSVPFATVGNDEVCKATTLNAGGPPVCANSTLATTTSSDPGSNCSSPDHTLWYKYTATATGTVVLVITTASLPANPLHGWAGWYSQAGNCPNMSLTRYGYCGEFGNGGNNDTDYIVSPVLVAGVTYYIMIDGYSDDVGEFCISIPPCSPAAAVDITNITSNSAILNWSGTGTFIVEYGPAGFVPGTSTIAGAGGIIINPAFAPQTINGLSFSTTYDVYVRQNCSASGNGYSNNSIVASFTTLGQPPPNDESAGAIPLTIYEGTCINETAGTTFNATLSPDVPPPVCGDEPGGWDDDVWYSFTPSAGQIFVNVNFGLTGGYTDIAAQIYTSSDNTSTGTFSLFKCSDDGGVSNLPAFNGLRVTPGTTYFIRVFSDTLYVNSQFTICVTKSLPPNDDAVGAVSLIAGAGCTGAVFTNETATQSPGEPTGSCSSTMGYATVWYKFIAPPGGAVRISTATGSDNTLTNTRVALFQVTNPADYSNGNFQIIACDEDGGSGAFGNMSVLYATGLVPDNTYYIEVDKFDANTVSGSFCLTVDEIGPSMLSTSANCNSAYQTPAGSITSYNGWVPLMDDESKLIALVRNTAGSPVNGYTAVENINIASVRKDITSGEYYLDRTYTINNTADPSASLNVQLFFLHSDLERLKAVDAAASLPYLRVTKQTAIACQPDFVTANGTNSELVQMSYGSANGVNWLQTGTSGFANYYIHAVKSYLSAKVFLQGAFNPQLGRHKDVTTTWANVLNTYALKQPYDNSANMDTAREGYGAATLGGAGQQVVHVTNLDATGPGSLYAAIASNRIIVFDVSGTINNFGWESGSSVVSNLTIDGSTAPSPGITLNNGNHGNGLSFGQFCHDIIVKNIRVRNSANDGINVIGGYNFVFDHVSISGSGDGDLDLTEGAHDITVQWSIFGAGKAGWSGAMLIAYPGTKNITLHHNLYTTYGSGVGERSPLVHNATNFTSNPVSYLMTDFTNNIVWKWGNASNEGYGYGSAADYGGTLQCTNNFYQSSLSPNNAIISNQSGTGAKLYASGNISGNTGVNPNAATNVAAGWSVPSVTKQDACAAAALVIQKAGPRPLDDADQAFVNSVSLSNCPNTQNQAPFANAGSNITMALPNNSTILSGGGTDPDGTIVTYSWTRVSGPPIYSLGTANAPTTTLSNLIAGNYRFRLRVTDNNGAEGVDTVSVTVVNSAANQPPVANAGSSLNLTLPFNSTTLSGSATDADGSVTTYTWTRISGPTNYTFGTPNAAITSVSDLIQGTYVFRLTVTDDNGLSAFDNVTINVKPTNVNTTTTYAYAGTEKAPPGFFTSLPAESDVVDWILLEIKNNAGVVVNQRAAFLREDGQVVDIDGVSPVSLYGLGSGTNYLTVMHRNHLGISTQNMLAFAATSLGLSPATPTNFDFSSASDADIFGNASAYQVINGVNVMIGGNANEVKNVRFGGLNSDLVSILSALNGIQFAILTPVYHNADLNLDGIVRFGGLGSDAVVLLTALMGNQGLVITEQIR